ncbi:MULTISPECIES: flippase [Sphingomonas]|jgi:O-antigen/teichoic acid export membrane protein|uniref:flippase n=1 Tax=Sphingomonas TaxID=13687 RepID=UPI00082B5946|nr:MULTISPECIES: flippase [Sphingomonas]MBY0301334.1 flippase [Sphingomonas ginsenosidimutans]
MSNGNMRANIGWMFMWQIATYLFPLLTFPYLTRVLGARSYGEFSLSFAVATYLVLLTDWGFAVSAPAEISRERDDPAAVSRIFWTVLASKALLLGISLSLLTIAALTIPEVRQLAPVMFAAAGMTLANLFTVHWCLQGLERMGKSAIAMTCGRGLVVPATLLLVKSPDQAWLAAAILSCGSMIGGLFSVLMLRSMNIIRWHRPSWAEMRAQIAHSTPLFVSAISANLYTGTNTIVLGITQGPVAVGIFAAADRLRMAAQALVNPINQAVYPRTSRLMHQSRAEGMAFARKLLLFQGGFTLLISLTMFFGADLIIRILAGHQYDGSGTVLRILSPIPFMAGVSSVFGMQVMLPLGLKGKYSRVFAVTAVVNFLMVVPLSWWAGATGTACSALAAETLSVGYMILTAMRHTEFLARPDRSGAMA